MKTVLTAAQIVCDALIAVLSVAVIVLLIKHWRSDMDSTSL